MVCAIRYGKPRNEEKKYNAHSSHKTAVPTSQATSQKQPLDISKLRRISTISIRRWRQNHPGGTHTHNLSNKVHGILRTSKVSKISPRTIHAPLQCVPASNSNPPLPPRNVEKGKHLDSVTTKTNRQPIDMSPDHSNDPPWICRNYIHHPCLSRPTILYSTTICNAPTRNSENIPPLLLGRGCSSPLPGTTIPR